MSHVVGIECPEPDLNGDGDQGDAGELPSLTGPNLNGDTVVDASDLSILLARFGTTCGM